MTELLEMIAKALVDNPDQVQVRAIEGEEVTVLQMRVHPSDVGKVIGRQGRMAESIRIIQGAAALAEISRKLHHLRPIDSETV